MDTRNDGREAMSSGLGAPEALELQFGWLHRFARHRGVVRTTILITFFGTLLSIALTVLAFNLAGRPITTFGVLLATCIPVICAPIATVSIIRILLRIDRVEEQRWVEFNARLKVEHALRENTSRLEAIFENANDIIFIINFEGEILLHNHRAMIDLHYENELKGMHLARLCPERDLRVWLSEIIEQGSGVIESHVQKKQGDKLLAIITATVIDRARQEIQIIVHDITEQKKIEQTLREAKEASDEANKLKSRFVFNVSHDIRTPLHGIIGFAEMVVAEKSLDRAQQHGWTILNESETLLTLINDLLDLAKIESGKMEISPEPLDITSLASSAISPMINVAKNKKLELKWTLQPQTPRYVEADPMRIRQILLNLIGNAIKFTKKGEVELAIGTHEQEDGERQLIFTVMDTGIGIDNSKQNMIFQSFTQADATTTRRYGGTGLGTTIARELVYLMEGEIGVISVPNSGSTFWFTIPLREVPAEAVPKQAPRSKGAEPLVTKTGTILLAEDYPTNQLIATLQLTSVDHDVTVVENGEEAVAICDKRRFDLILMDIQMPRMDGQEATQQIRKSSKLNAETPILALTASGETSTRDTCLHAGMNDTLVKPLRRNSLLEIVESWLTRDGQAPRPLKKETVKLDGTDEAPSKDPIDWNKALEQFGENREILEITLNKFIKQTALDLEEMRQTLEEQELETLRKQAHRLKGAAAYLAARPISKAAAELETESKAQSSEIASKASELIQHIDDELHRLEASVSQNQNH